MSKKEERKMKKAVWQYLIDHSRKNRNGTYQISFLIKSDHDFWDRVRARERGYFSRKNLKDENKNLKKMNELSESKCLELKLTKKFQKKHADALDNFNNSDNIKDIECRKSLQPLVNYRNKRIKEFLNTTKA